MGRPRVRPWFGQLLLRPEGPTRRGRCPHTAYGPARLGEELGARRRCPGSEPPENSCMRWLTQHTFAPLSPALPHCTRSFSACLGRCFCLLLRAGLGSAAQVHTSSLTPPSPPTQSVIGVFYDPNNANADCTDYFCSQVLEAEEGATTEEELKQYETFDAASGLVSFLDEPDVGPSTRLYVERHPISDAPEDGPYDDEDGEEEDEEGPFSEDEGDEEEPEEAPPPSSKRKKM